VQAAAVKPATAAAALVKSQAAAPVQKMVCALTSPFACISRELTREWLAQAANEALAYLPMKIFAEHEEGNKHGFHSGHIITGGRMRKDLDEVTILASASVSAVEYFSPRWPLPSANRQHQCDSVTSFRYTMRLTWCLDAG
jgi:hypothetical protein